MKKKFFVVTCLLSSLLICILHLKDKSTNDVSHKENNTSTNDAIQSGILDSKAKIRMSKLDAAKQNLLNARTNFPNIRERSQYCASQIRELCENGMWEQAWELIDANSGTRRNYELSAFFSCSGLTWERTISFIQNLSNTLDIQNALSCKVNQLDIDQLLELSNDSVLMKQISLLSPSSNRLLTNSVYASITEKTFSNNSYSNEILFSKSLALLDRKMLDERDYYNILVNDNTVSALSKWELVNSRKELNSPDGSFNSQRKELIRDMMSEDASNNINAILKSQTDIGILDLQTALTHWHNIDSHEATEWYLSNYKHLQDQQSDGASTAFFQLSIEAKDYENAQRWSALIKDASIKKQAYSILAKIAVKDK